MRIMLVGSTSGPLGQAGKMAHDKGAQIVSIDNTPAALEALRAGKGADLVMVELSQDISFLIENMKSERIQTSVVACGTAADSDAAIKAIKSGAKEYIPLPPDAELIAALLESIATDRTDMIASDPAMTKTVTLAKRIAPSDASVLITGESGTGKEVMARFVHQNSKRADKQFVSVNCAAIPDHLLESELFGHEKGAFTGAVARRIGKFEEAGGGTLLLDEVTEMDPRLQAKLLRAIQEREIDRVGGSTPVKVDIRLIATSNRDMKSAVAEGKFREDLYFRLNVVTLDLPPLRQRPGDIEQLAQFFQKKYAAANGLSEKPFSADTLQALKSYSWPGNVRELENAVHRAVLLSTETEITPEDIMLEQAESKTEADMVGRPLADVEQELILGTLDHCLGNRTHAANLLGISIRTLRNKLRQYADDGVSVPEAGVGG